MKETNPDSMMGRKFNVCFFALNAYSYLSEGNHNFAGGAERQQVLLAKELARRGHRISFIVNDYRQPDIEKIGDIIVYKNSLPKFKNIIILFKIINIFHFWKILENTGADIYYQRTAGSITGNIALFCLFRRKKFVYSIAHKFDVDGTCIHESYLTQKISIIKWCYKSLFILGLRLADCVIAQNNNQLALLQNNFSKKGTIIRSIYNVQENTRYEKGSSEILWIASIQSWKGPEIFLELAKKIPEARFRMIGGASVDKNYFESIKNKAHGISNLEFTGFVQPDKIQQFYKNAIIFINTSDSEGFPNTFLEAWSHSVPVVSLNVDPDEIISKNELGFHSENVSQLIEDVRKLLQNDELRNRLGQNGRKYVEKEHSVSMICKRYEQVFDNLIN